MIHSQNLKRFALSSLITACLAVISMFLSGAPTQAQLLLTERAAPMQVADAFKLEVRDRDDGTRELTWEIAKGYYLYRDYLAAETDAGTKVPLVSPSGIPKDDPTFGSVEVYYDLVQVDLAAAEGPVTLTYQGCQEDGICYPPVKRTLPALAASAQALASIPTDKQPIETEATKDQSSQLTLSQDGGLIEGLRQRGGVLFVLTGFFAFGLLLAFTPCMFPMYPILAGLLSGQGQKLTARRGITLSSVYVLAMASAFGLLGVAAAWSGQNLQIVLQSPVAIYVAAAVFVILALSMFGLFEIQLPAAWTRRISTVGTSSGGTLGGAAALGFSSALIMGPCVTAPLAGALLYIAGTGDVALGAAALFALGLGQGVPLLVVGALGARALPRAGGWMQGFKLAFGFIFLGMSIWLIGRVSAGPEILALWSALLIGGGIFAGAMDLLPVNAGPVRRLIKTAGVFSLLAGAIMLFGAALGGDDPMRPLDRLRASAGSGEGPEKSVNFVTVVSRQSLEAALSNGAAKPSLIYVTADWCVTCRVIEREVWADASVQAALSQMTVIAADVSDFGPEGQAMLDQLGAVGPPTMIFLNSDGKEPPNTRIVGDTTVKAVLSSTGML
tara:strand:+ start:5451 stop:7289 length:1839 start_codon:yes stop_codon:yes gene_type:complete